MNYKKIIEKIGKYHYILVIGKKSGILGSSNKLSEAKKKTIDILKDKKNKYDNFNFAKLKISKISNKNLKLNEESKIKIYGGPIEIKIKFYEIKNNKIKILKDYFNNNKLYITDKFLKKNKLDKKTIQLVASLAHNNKLSKKLFVINTIDKYIKK